MIRYCTRCVMPETRPDLFIDKEGVCNACRNFEKREHVDWKTRHEELLRILERYRHKDGAHWDCIIPVSGGKDSTFQVIKMLELGMNPLCVCASTCDLSEVGAKNLENLKRLGVDLIHFSPNPVIRAKLNRIGLTEVGDICWPEHVSIFTVPVRVAIEYKVPLIVWGENFQNEYGGPAAVAEKNVLDRKWLEEFGGLLGMRVTDLIGVEGIEKKHLLSYLYPSDEEFRAVGVTGLFLGHYLPWDSFTCALVSQAYGLVSSPTVVEGTMLTYDKLDNHYHGIHDYFKFLKFGFARATDEASLHVRRKRLTRAEAVQIVRKLDGAFPWSYLGKPLEAMLRQMDMSLEPFIAVCDRFTNRKLFVLDSKGNPVKGKNGNLTKVNYDNA